MLNYNNVDPMLGQLMTQMLQIRQQIVSVHSVDTSSFLSAIDSFVNHIGEQIQAQASKETPWNYTVSSPLPAIPEVNPAMSADELLKTVQVEPVEELV